MTKPVHDPSDLPALTDAKPATLPPLPVAAGDFATWVATMTASLRGRAGNDVPCGDCVGCCSSYWPVALRAEDEAVVTRLPAQWLITPANAPTGLRYMAYRPDGTCPMLEHGRCSVYADRPQTCRDFDCRLFAATGIDSAGADKPLINARIVAWRFTYESAADVATHEAMRATARFLQQVAASQKDARLPTSPIAIAGIAFKAHPVFLDPRAGSMSAEALLAAVIRAARAFDTMTSTLASPAST